LSSAGGWITAPDAAPPASANVNSETHYLFSPASTRSIRGWNGSACRTWKRPCRPSCISRWSGKSGLKLSVPPLASAIRDGVPGCPSVSMESKRGPGITMPLRRGYFPALPIGMAHGGCRFRERTAIRNRATHFVATWVWRAGHAQMTAIHFRAIKQHPIILK
jgi:hypothetical protein